MRSAPFNLIPLALLLATAGCLTMKLPADFLVLEEAPGSFRAVTADEAKVWVREFSPAARDGSLSFWRDALKKDFEDNRGYVVLEENTVTDGHGREGVELLCESQVGGRAQRYLISVFVLRTPFGNDVRTVEYVADKERFDEHLASVREGIKTLP